MEAVLTRKEEVKMKVTSGTATADEISYEAAEEGKAINQLRSMVPRRRHKHSNI